MEKQDLRIRKTKRAIYHAFSELIKEKTLDKITVTALASRAEINKATFYLHYRDIYDLYQDALQEHLKEVAQKISFMDLFFLDIEAFAKKLVHASTSRSIFENDAFLSKENAPYNQGAMLYFCNILTDIILNLGQIENTEENKMKLQFIFSGIGTLFRFDTNSNPDVMISILVSACRSQFANL